MTVLTLIIDTSVHGAAVGILTEGRHDLIFSAFTEDVADSARQLPLMVERGLKESGAESTDISSIIISQGPGSFTGIRVGLAYVYGLSFGLASHSGDHPKVSGVSALKTLAESLARRESVDIVLCLPSTKSGGYIATTRNGVATLGPVDLLVDDATFGWPKRWFMIGDWEMLSAKAGALNDVAIVKLGAKDAARDSIHAMADLMCQDGGISWSQALPDAIYLRKSTVEEKAGPR